MSIRVLSGTVPYNMGAPGLANCPRVIPANTSAFVRAMIPASVEGAVVPAWGDEEPTTGMFRRQISINDWVVSSTNWRGLFTRQVMKDNIGFPLSLSSPPAMSGAIARTLSSLSGFVNPGMSRISHSSWSPEMYKEGDSANKLRTFSAAFSRISVAPAATHSCLYPMSANSGM